MNTFPPCASIEQYIGRRLLAMLAAMALADIVIVLCVSMSTVLAGTGGGTQDVVRARAMEVLNAEGQPILVATSDESQNGILWLGARHGQGGVSLNVDEGGSGYFAVYAAQGVPQIAAVARHLEGGALQVYDDGGQQIGFLGASEAGSGHLTLHGKDGGLLVVAGEDEGSGLLMANNSQGINIFLAGADSAQNGGLLVNSRTGENLIYAGAGKSGNGGLHVNAGNEANLIFLGADEYNNGAVGIWDREGKGSLLTK